MDGKTSIVLKGAAAELKWGWHTAATLEKWEITEGRATANVVSADQFKVTQQPLTLVVTTNGGHKWTWPVAGLQIAGTSISIALAEE